MGMESVLEEGKIIITTRYVVRLHLLGYCKCRLAEGLVENLSPAHKRAGSSWVNSSKPLSPLTGL